jgi:hypothetical protein
LPRAHAPAAIGECAPPTGRGSWRFK